MFDRSGTVKLPGNAPAGADPQADTAASLDADGLVRRGAASAARRDFPNAIRDLNRAIELAPNEPRYRYARAAAYRAAGQLSLARLDLDSALALKPDYVEALIDRAAIFLATSARSAGLSDLDAAARIAPNGGNVHMALAELYVRTDSFDAAIWEYGRWLATHGPQDSRYSQALNGRCWARTALGRDLDQALADCNAAVRAAPDAAGYRDSRGLTYLRMGDYARAIADYDEALKLQPKIAWSLYGRGIAKQHKGRKDEGDEDIAAALAIDPTVADQMRRYRIIKGVQ